MKILYLAIAILWVAVMGSEVSATPDPVSKTIAPFVKKKPSRVQPWQQPNAAVPVPVPMPAITPTRDGSITDRNYIGFEAALVGGMFIGGDVTFTFDHPFDDLNRNAQYTVRPVGEHGLGLGFSLGGVLDLALSDAIGFQTKLSYKSITASGSRTDTFFCRFDNVPGVAMVEDVYDMTFGMVGADFLGRFQFMDDGLYGLLGFGANGILSVSNASTQEFLSSPNGCQYTNVSGVRTNQTRIELETDRYLDSVQRARLDLRFGVGTWIPLGDNGMMLVPELTASFPLTSVFTSAVEANKDLPSLAYLALSVAIKFPWGANAPEPAIIRGADVAISGGAATPEPGKAHLSGRVVNYSNELIPNATITVVDLATNEVVAIDKTTGGIYNVQVIAPGRYSVTADAPGYLFGSSFFEVDRDGRIIKHSGDIRLAPYNDGRVRLLVFFDFDKATLQSSSYPELDRAAALMKANPDMRVEIAGFTDSQGADQYNKELSQRRANTVREYIVQQGVDGERLIAIGYGEESPVATNDTEAGRADNRRVEFVVKRR